MMARTKIGIIGAGNMGRAFATRLAAAGHNISITATDPAHAEEAAERTRAPSARMGSPVTPTWSSSRCPTPNDLTDLQDPTPLSRLRNRVAFRSPPPNTVA
jgi:shikimate 5-dehydrogenase